MSRTYRDRRYRMAPTCPVSGKASFRSTVAARAFVRSRDEWRGEVARAYRCEHCDWYHLTSKRTLWELARIEAAA